MKNGVTINLDKPRTLRYGINALVKVEDLTGKSITALDLSHVGIKDLLIIVYAGLCHEDKTLTLEKVGDLIDEYSNITEIAEKLGEAFTLAFGKAEGKQGGISETAFDLSEFCEKAVVFFDIDPIQIGNYTPYEVMLLAKQKRERETRLFEDNITLAWHTEAFARQKKLPILSKILKDVRKKPKKTNSAGDAVLKAMAAEQGIIIK